MELFDLNNTVNKLKILLRLLGFPGCSVGKESTCNAEDAGDVDSNPGLGRFLGGKECMATHPNILFLF